MTKKKEKEMKAQNFFIKIFIPIQKLYYSLIEKTNCKWRKEKKANGKWDSENNKVYWLNTFTHTLKKVAYMFW